MPKKSEKAPETETQETVKKKRAPKKAPEETHDETCTSPSCTHEHHAPKESAPATPKVDEPIQTQEFHSDKADVIVETRAYCRIKMTVKAKASLMKEARKMAMKQIAKEVSIPGFRKGKVPDEILEKQFSKAIAQGWDKAFADLAFQEGGKLSQVSMLGGDSKISYQISKMTQEEGEISFSFECEPVIPQIDYSKISLPKEAKAEEITEQKVGETLKYLQMFYAKWNQVTDRPIKEGDFVILDIDDLDVDPPVQAFSNSRFEVVKGKMSEWMRQLVLGKNLNDQIEGISSPDENETDDVKKEFKAKKVKLYIRAIEEANLPELDDELAKKLGVPDVSTLKERLTTLLTKQAQERLNVDLRDLLTDELLQKVVFDVPASILEKEANYRMQQLFRQPDLARKWKEEMSEAEKEAKKQEVKEEAIRILKLFYLCKQVIGENQIELTEEEIAPDYDTLLEMMFADPSSVNYRNQSKEQKAMTFSKHMMAKALDFIIDKINRS